MDLKKEGYYWKKYNIYSKTKCTEITTKICAQDKKSPFARIYYKKNTWEQLFLYKDRILGDGYKTDRV